MTVATLRIEHFRGIRRLDPDGDGLTLRFGRNNSGRTGVLDDPGARSPGRRPAPGCSQHTTWLRTRIR